MTRARLRRALTALLVTAAIGFLVAAVLRDLPQLRAFPWDVRPVPLALSVAALSGILAWGVWVWQQVLRGFGITTSFIGLCRVWFLSNLAKYVPGKIWQFVGVSQLGASSGLPAATAVTSLVVHMAFTLLAAGIVTLLFLPAALLPVPGGASARWLAPLLLLAAHPRLLRATLSVVERVSRRPLAPWQGTWARGVGLVGLNAVSWVLYGAALRVFVGALVPLDGGGAAAFAAINALAFIAGYLVVFAPAGIGAKELALAGLLSTLMPGSVAAAVALAVRLWTVAAEVIPAVLLLRTRPARPISSSGAGPDDPLR